MPSVLGLYLRRYPYLFICLAIGCIGLLLYRIPGVDPALAAGFNDHQAYVLIGGIVSFAMARRARRSVGLEERRLWGWLGLSFALWTGAEIILSIVPAADQPGSAGLPADALYFLSYSAWFLGINQAPHHPSGWTGRQPGWRLEQWGTLVVSLGLALDLSILPQLVSPASEQARLCSSGLFVAFDAAILLRLVALASRATATHWRRWYGTMALMAAGMLAMDILVAGIDNQLIPAYSGPLFDLAWYLPFWVLAVACSLPTHQPEAAGATELAARHAEEGVSPLEGGLVLYTSAFVVTHLIAGLTPLLPGTAEIPRSILALVVVLTLCVLAYLRQLSLESRVDQLSRELRQATFDMADARRLQAVARLAGGVAHDFNNLLTVIVGYCEMLRGSLPLGTVEHRDVGRIQDAALRAARLTADLLSFGDPLPLRLEPHDLNTLLEQAEDEIRALAGSMVSLGIERASIPRVPVDPGRLRAAVLQLARNAVEAMPEGGRLTFATSRAHFDAASPDRPSLVPPGSYSCLSVEDTGRGMDTATQASLFDPYFTTKEFGMSHGLGLAAVHGIVTKHGGHILVQSEVGRGTRFQLLFPAEGSAALPIMASGSQGTVSELGRIH